MYDQVSGPYQGKNVIGKLQGKGDEFVVIGAHYDSLPVGSDAPGADDNGSGVASLLMVRD